MNFGVTGSRPPSARRPASASRNVNPITGVELPMSGHNSARDPRPQEEARYERPSSGAISRAGSRPDGVPSLNLAPVIGRDDEKSVPIEFANYNHDLKSPSTATTVSWGTPTSDSYRKRMNEVGVQLQGPGQYSSYPSQRLGGMGHQQKATQRKPKPKQPTAWDRDPCPENLPAPSDRYKQKYKEYEHDMKHAYKYKGHVDEDQVAAKMAEMRLDLGGGGGADDVDDPRDQLQREWTANPYTKAHNLRRLDVEELEMIKKKNKLIETVMIDQLSRGVMCDPEQDTIRTGRQAHHTPGMKRGAVRTLHDSKVATSGMATENMLNRRVRFDARILTQNGRDAVRELMGFYFDMDNSITVYEYKIFGKTAKALPFILRGRYRRISGRRTDELYDLPDIVVGGTLYFHTADQPLPDCLKAHPAIAFRITDMDNAAKEQILLGGVAGYRQREEWETLHLPTTQQERDDLHLLSYVQKSVQKQLRRRGVKVLTGLGRLFRSHDRSGDGRLNKYELEKALIDYHIDVDQDRFDDLWMLLDTDNSGYLDYGEFVRGFIGEMAENRKDLVRKAFTKVDTTRKGVLPIAELAKFYKANQHPKVCSGELDEDEVRTSFLSAFTGGATKDHVTYPEFEQYYEGLSLGVDDDGEFANILRNAWSV